MSDRLRMNAYAARHLKEVDRIVIERNIPAGLHMAVQAEQGAGDWSIRIYEDLPAGSPRRVVPTLLVTSKHHKTIRGGAFVALAKLASIDPAMTVTVDLDGTPTLHGWERKDAA